MRLFTISAVASIAICAASSASADPVEDFYRAKKQITLVTSASPGGGYDQYARLLARFLPNHIPGAPAIIVQNMVGAEGIKAANYLFAAAAQDGSVIGGLQRNTALAGFYGIVGSVAQFDPRGFHWLGSPQQETGVFIVSTRTGVHTADDLKTRAVTVASTSRNAPTSIYPRLLNAIYGSKITVVEGYEGSQATLLSVERGEVDGEVSGGSSAAYRARIKPWIDSGQATVVVQMSMKRDKAFPNAPTAIELAPDVDGKRLFEIAFTEQVMGRPFVLPPNVPDGRVQALRAAFDATMQDPEFLAAAETERIDIDPVNGAKINELIDRVYAAPPALVDRLRELVK